MCVITVNRPLKFNYYYKILELSMVILVIFDAEHFGSGAVEENQTPVQLLCAIFLTHSIK